MSVAASIPPITVVPMTCRATASDPDAVQNGTLPRRAPQPHLSRGIGRKARRQGMDLSFHSLRHSAVTWLKTASIPHATIMGLIGHESLLMSGHYTHIGREELGRAVRALPEI
jgi:integrase